MTHRGSGTVNNSSEHLWRNNGDLTFTDVSTSSGISVAYQGQQDFTFTPNLADINNDGYPDILMAADFTTSQVFINQKNGTFQNTKDENVVTDENGMEAAVGDYDNDGNLDLIHVNGFGFTPTGQAFEYFEDPTRVFISNGDGTFTEQASKLELKDVGQGRGLVCFDYDRDGDIDVFIFSNNQAGKLFRNDGGNNNNFLNVKLNGLPPNTEGIGAGITVMANSKAQMRELSAGSNFVSQNPAEEHFGLGWCRKCR